MSNVKSCNEYNKLEEKEKDKYLEEYTKDLELQIKRQLKENEENIVKDLRKTGKINQAERLENEFNKGDTEISINIDENKELLEKSLSEPVFFEGEMVQIQNNKLETFKQKNSFNLFKYGTTNGTNSISETIT